MKRELEVFVQRTARRALVAEESPHVSSTTILSRQGAGFLGIPGERSPQRGGKALLPILAVHTPELPSVPEFLRSHPYWAFFIQPDLHEQTVDDGTLVVRRYADVTVLTVLPECEPGPCLDLQFREVTDYPSTFALRHALADNRRLFTSDDTDWTELEATFPCHSGLKIGGYPHLIQGTAFLETLEPDFQVQLDASDVYMYGDSGIGYVYSNLNAVIWECM